MSIQMPPEGATPPPVPQPPASETMSIQMPQAGPRPAPPTPGGAVRKETMNIQMPPEQKGAVASAVSPELGTSEETMGIQIPGETAAPPPDATSGQTIQIPIPGGGKGPEPEGLSTTMRIPIPEPGRPSGPPPSPEEGLSTTMRIDIPVEPSSRPGQPPRPSPKLGASSTVMLTPLTPAQSGQPGAAVGIPQAGVVPGAAPGSKRETSKIPLEAATSTEGGPKKPKTIRIKPASAPGAASADAPAKDAKRETSRISLEAALGTEEDAPGAPKTIRLKRPSEAPTVRAKPTEMSQTARLDGAGVEDAESPTQKKTIKVKRPTERKAVKSVSARHPIAPGAAREPAAEPVVDSAHWTFLTFAIASVLICFVLIYVLCAQTFGPNVDQTTLTPLSYGANDMSLSWPGKVRYH